MRLQVDGLMLLGRGVAYQTNAEALQRLHRRLAAAWDSWLIPQDRQGFRPHVVIQNKAEPALARALYADLSASFRPFAVIAVGLHLWRYLGGPWASLTLVPFSGVDRATGAV